MKSKDELKICVYAICHNESKFVEKWLDSMQEADYIVVLDTGSTDGTYEMLKNDSRVTVLAQKTYSPWRFDTPRNDSMDLAPEDTDIFISTDLDEILEPGWVEAIKEQWTTGNYVRGNYKYSWNHQNNGENGLVFWYDKVHIKGYRWIYPVHEALSIENQEELERNATIQFDERVFLHHYPDETKSRSFYLDLLKLRIKEFPNDFYGRFYLAREYMYAGLIQESIDEFNIIIKDFLKYNVEDSMMMMSGAYNFLGECYERLGDNTNALKSYFDSINYNPTYREPYIYAAQILNAMGLNRMAIGMVEDAFRKSYQHFSWLEKRDVWNELPYDILSIAYYYTNEFEKGKECIEKALELAPNDERLKTNYTFFNK